jgi:hypothetical protein
MRAQIRRKLDTLGQGPEQRTMKRALEVQKKKSSSQDQNRLKNQGTGPSRSKLLNNGKLLRSSSVPRVKWALQPNSLPITIITDKQPGEEGGSKKKKKSFGGKLTPKVSLNPKGSVSLRSAVRLNKVPGLSKQQQTNTATHTQLQEQRLTDAIRSQPKSKSKKVVPLYRPQTSNPRKTLNQDDFHWRKQTPMPTIQHHPLVYQQQEEEKPAQEKVLFKSSLDMHGFKNEEISLDLEDRKLTVSS